VGGVAVVTLAVVLQDELPVAGLDEGNSQWYTG
jgi:hypothetical protein